MSKQEKPRTGETEYTVECILCHRRFVIPTNRGPVVPFHLGPKGFRCPGANHPGRIVKNVI